MNIWANTFLKIGKPTEENLLPYKSHNGRFELLKLTFNLFKFFPVLILHLSREIVRSIYYSFKEDIGNWNGGISDALFISHYTHHSTNSLEDTYFGLLPNHMHLRSKSAAIFLLNHTKRAPSEIEKEFGQENNVPRYASRKALKLHDLFGFIKTQFPASMAMLLGAVRIGELDLGQRLLLVDASLNQFSRPTFAAITVIRNLEKILNWVKPKQVFFTFEGHSFEILGIKMIQRNFPDIRVFLYQFAPIVKNQFGLYGTLRELDSNTTVLTTGRAVQKYFNDIAPHSLCSIEVLGSPKRSYMNPLNDFHSEEQGRLSVCLFAPEGTNDSFQEMLHLSLICSRILPEKTFILRLHPAFPIKSN